MRRVLFFVGRHRGGAVVEFHPSTGVCASRADLGDNNHTPAFAVSFPDGS